MNFDDLQKEWNNQSSGDLNIDPNLDKLKSANNILEELRKKIKGELVAVILSIIFLLLVPYISIYKVDGISAIFYYFFMFYMILGSVITYVRFFHFFKVSKQYEINSSREALLKVYYELKYALDTYLITTIVATPSGIALYFILFSFGNTEKYFQQLINVSETMNTNPIFYVYILLLVVLSLLFIGILVYWFYVKIYGKRLNQIKQILDDLDE